jgi:hypothetical protein
MHKRLIDSHPARLLGTRRSSWPPAHSYSTRQGGWGEMPFPGSGIRGCTGLEGEAGFQEG